MAGEGGNDFYLKFSSNANPFAENLAAQLEPGIAKINALRTAVQEYERTAAASKSGSSPLGLTFEGLDGAAERIEKATANFSVNFERQIEALTSKVAGLAEILNTVSRRVPPPGAGGGAPPVTPPRTPPPVRPRGDNFSPEQEAILRGQRRGAGVAGVSAADKAAADKAKTSAKSAAEATGKLAEANALTAQGVKATSTALRTLNTQLERIVATADKLRAGSGGASGGDVRGSNAEGVLQISNTPANPVPVILVGGEAQASGGHPGGHHGPTPTAVSATATARAKEQMEAAAELVNAPNSRRNPTRVTPGDSIVPGQYFLLPGDDAKNPRRAYGLRPGETAGQYVGRVDAVQGREAAYLARTPRLSDDDAERLRQYGEAYGPFPAPKERVKPGSVGKSQQQQDTVNARALPPEVNDLLRRRDMFAAETQDQAHSFVLDELRRDPHLTQDGLSRESKAALSRIDNAILAIRNKSQAARLFDSTGTPELDELRQGATRRRYLADTGSAVYAEHEQSRADLKYIRDEMYGSPKSERALGDDPKGHLARAEQEAQSLDDQAAVNAQKASVEVQNARLAEKRKIAHARRQIAQQFSERLDRSADLGGFIEDPTDLDEKGAPRLTSRDRLNREFQAMTQSTGMARDMPIGKLKVAAREYLQRRIAEDHETSLDTLAARVDEPAASGRRRGKATLAEDQTVTAAAEAVGQIDQIKGQIHDLNRKLSDTRKRLDRTSDGSTRNQRYVTQIAKLEAQKKDLQAEKTRLNREAARSNNEQVDNSPEGLLARGLITEGELPAARAWQESQARRAAAGGGGAKPPTPPSAPPAASEPEPEPAPKPRRVRPVNLQGGAGSAADRLHQFNQLDEDTQRAILAERSNLANPALSEAERRAAINRAALALREDSQYSSNPKLWGGGSSASRAAEKVRALTGMLDLDVGSGPTRAVVQRGIQAGASLLRAQSAGRVDGTGSAAKTEEEFASAAERSARAEQIANGATGRLLESRLALARVEEQLRRIRADNSATLDQELAAMSRVSAASRANMVEEGRSEQSRYSRLTGRSPNATFGKDLLRHGSYALENTIGYGLVFTGFEKLREVVQTGIETQAVFVRLQQSLDANGISAGNLQTKLAQISANTATPLEQVNEAAAELAGSFNNIGSKAERLGNIEFATNIASQLANISQGTLTAQQAAEGLRDVIYAYGDAWAQSGLSVKQGLQQTGDQIAHLSQLTGVSVKDITEGTTQIAQEAHEFGLKQRQASTLAAYITAGTGETGEQSAAQASRMLATLYTGKTQGILEKTRLFGADGKPMTNADGSPRTLATAQEFEQGKIGEVLTNIAAHWQQLTPRERQEISAQMGQGIQARAFSAYVGGGARAAREMNGTANDTGALNRQNQSYLQTVAGMIKQLDEDFQNLGSTLQRLGAFDAIGILAKSMDELFKTFNKVFGGIASFMDSNPVTAGLMHWSVVILEAAAAWKLFGASATNALLRSSRFTPAALGVSAVEGGAVAGSAGAAEGAAVRYERARFGNVLRAVGSNAGGGFLSVGQRDVRSFLPGGMSPVAARAAADAEVEASAGRLVVANNLVAESQTREAELKAAGAATQEEEATAAAATAEALAGLTAATEALTAAQMEQAIVIGYGSAGTPGSVAGLGSRLNSSFLAKAGVVAGVGILGWHELSAAGNDASARRAADARIIAGKAAPGDYALNQDANGGDGSLAGTYKSPGFRNWLTGNSTSKLGEAGNVAKNVGEGIVNGIVGGFTHPFGGSVANAVGHGPFKISGQGGPSDKSSQAALDLMNLVYNVPGQGAAQAGAMGRLGYGNGPARGIADVKNMGSVGEVQAWEKRERAFIAKHASDIEKLGGNDPNSQAKIAQTINTLKANLTKTANNRIATLEGLSTIDRLTANQVSALTTTLGQMANLSPETLATQKGAIATLLSQAGLPTSSKAYRDLAGAANVGQIGVLGRNAQGQIGSYGADGAFTRNARMSGARRVLGEDQFTGLGAGPGADGGMTRLRDLRAGYQEAITNARVKIDAGGLSPADQATWTNNLNTAITGWQQTNQQIRQAPIAQAQSQAGLLSSLSGTPGIARQLGLPGGGDQAAVAQLRIANRDIGNYNRTLAKTDPQYYSNLQQIAQNKQQIAELQSTPQINRLLLAAAQATDATAQANINVQQALAQYQKHLRGGASLSTLGQDKASIAAGRVSATQANEAAAAATAQANMAGIRNDQGRAQAGLNEALREESVYRQGGALADRASYENAIAQEEQYRIQIADATEAAKESAIDAAAALAKMHGNEVGAAQDELSKAREAYAYAVAQYGKTSQQAETALAALYGAQQSYFNAQLEQTNSFLDLQIAQLNASGQAGDAEKAAQDAVKKAQNAIASYLAHGGQKGTKTYNDLQAQLVTAQRTAFDTQLQAQLDTLDFEKETYKITSAQEVQALQQILKNKQLTLKEQRDITLKIKSLQDSIRQQLTQGGLNIPSNITLPTAYDVRRSLGAGFGGSGSANSTVNNNNQQVQINNTVSTDAQIARITQAVVNAINSQTSMQSRSSTSTPRLVGTR